MIVAKVSRGSSFKGITAYLASPKEGQHRAEWSATTNLGTNDVDLGARLMAATAMDADKIKRANGWNGKGRKSTTKPVYHVIMSWDESRHPDAAHQEQSARDMLDKIGMGKAQSILVGHNDNGKTHVHIVVNLIDPETGIQFKLSNDQKKMQKWALDYCIENGIDIETIAPNRAKNAQSRQTAANENTPLKPDAVEGNKRLSRPEWLKMRNALFERQGEERAALKQLHKSDWREAKAAIAVRKTKQKEAFRLEHAHQKRLAKEANRPKWRKLFADQKAEKLRADTQLNTALQDFKRSSTLMGRVVAALPFTKTLEQSRAALSQAHFRVDQLKSQHDRDRKALGKRLADETFKRTVNAIPREQKLDLTDMKARHDQDWTLIKARHDQEREKAGVRTRSKHAQSKTREETQKKRASFKERQQRMKAKQSEESRRNLHKMRQRDAQSRKANRDRDKDRER